MKILDSWWKIITEANFLCWTILNSPSQTCKKKKEKRKKEKKEKQKQKKGKNRSVINTKDGKMEVIYHHTISYFTKVFVTWCHESSTLESISVPFAFIWLNECWATHMRNENDGKTCLWHTQRKALIWYVISTDIGLSERKYIPDVTKGNS